MKYLAIMFFCVIPGLAGAGPVSGTNDGNQVQAGGGAVRELISGPSGHGTSRAVREDVLAMLEEQGVHLERRRRERMTALGFSCNDASCSIVAQNVSELKGAGWYQSVTKIFDIHVAYMATPMQVSVKRTVIRNIPTQLGIDPIGMLIYRNGPFASNKQFADTVKEFLKGFMRQGLASSLPRAGFVCADRCVYSGKQQVDTETEQDISIKRYSYTIEVGIDDVPSSINAVQSSE